jgi:protein-disulfide isomerase
MAYVSAFELGALCLQCSALYLLTGALVIVLLRASALFPLAWPSVAAPLPGRTAAITAGAALAATVAVAAVTWPSTAALPAGRASLEDLRKADPRFYDWYTGLPVLSKHAGVGDARHAVGNSRAPVTIVEFSDFECGYCRRNHELLKDLIGRRPGEVRVVYRHFPLDPACNEALDTDMHRRACRAAEAAECAARQSRFSEMADALFANQRSLYDRRIFALAQELGLDAGDFQDCMNKGLTLGAVIEDARLGNKLGINSTPTLFINGRQVTGTFESAVGYDLAVLIETRLAARASHQQ